MPAAGIASAIISGVGVIQQGNAANESNAISQKQLEIQTKNSYLNGLNSIRDYEKSIADLEGTKIQYGIDIRDAQSQIDSYDKWLGNYSKQYAQEVQSKQAQINNLVADRTVYENNAKNQISGYDAWLGNYSSQYAQEVKSKQAQTDALMASGKESYESFLNAIGYADATAGATGRVGAGTSQSKVTSMIDQKLVDYVGDDRRLDANGGLFGSQLTAANMEMDQLKTGLEMQRQDVVGNKANILNNFNATRTAYSSQLAAANMEMDQLKVDLDFQRQEMAANRQNMLGTIGDWRQAIKLTDQSIANSTAAKNDLQEFIDINFGPNSGNTDNGKPTVTDIITGFLDPIGGFHSRGDSWADVGNKIINPLGIFGKIF
jgi:hypothetical protein